MNGYLIDENLPSARFFPCSREVVHARSLATMATDTQLWTYAKEHALAIVTKDSDFSHRILPATPPPWVVHFVLGNMRRQDMILFIEKIWPAVERLLPDHKLLRIFPDHIEGVLAA